jgi:L-amino acid N-acyltransferase YncA
MQQHGGLKKLSISRASDTKKMASSDIKIRAAKADDIPAVNAIHKHYIENTIITFHCVARTDEEAGANFAKHRETGLPFLVAEGVGGDGGGGGGGKILGWAMASPFRGSKGGYGHTVELSLCCHPDHLGQRTGSKLLSRLIEVLREPDKHSEVYARQRAEDERVKVLMAVMALDDQGRDGGWGLRDYYLKFGFEQVGHLRGVGHKFDRWQVCLQMC